MTDFIAKTDFLGMPKMAVQDYQILES